MEIAIDKPHISMVNDLELPKMLILITDLDRY